MLQAIKNETNGKNKGNIFPKFENEVLHFNASEIMIDPEEDEIRLQPPGISYDAVCKNSLEQKKVSYSCVISVESSALVVEYTVQLSLNSSPKSSFKKLSERFQIMQH